MAFKRAQPLGPSAAGVCACVCAAVRVQVAVHGALFLPLTVLTQNNEQSRIRQQKRPNVLSQNKSASRRMPEADRTRPRSRVRLVFRSTKSVKFRSRSGHFFGQQRKLSYQLNAIEKYFLLFIPHKNHFLAKFILLCSHISASCRALKKGGKGGENRKRKARGRTQFSFTINWAPETNGATVQMRRNQSFFSSSLMKTGKTCDKPQTHSNIFAAFISIRR